MKTLILAATVMVTAAECCDPTSHSAAAVNEASVQVCTDRGGVPIVEVMYDGGGHTFRALKGCAFPCDQRLVEKP
jgi:hypothetical protein